MTADMMGAMQRAWLCAGFGWFADPAISERALDTAGERPVLCLPTSYLSDPIRVEDAFAWGMCELRRRRNGWLALLRRLRDIEDQTHESEVA